MRGVAVPHQGGLHTRIAWASLTAAVLVTVIATGPLRASPKDPQITTPPAPDATVQPILDGCQRNPTGLLSRTSPEWVYVYDSQSHGSIPAPRWVSGLVSSNNPKYQAVHVSGGDLPTGHDAYDFNVNILPDAEYAYLMGGRLADHTGNFAGTGEETARLHTESEDTVVPQFAWPEPGDRVSELGSWVWDCGHWGPPTTLDSPDYLLPKVGVPCQGVPDPKQCAPSGERTEFHPYRALWVDRNATVTSPSGEHEGDLFITTEATKAGIEATCAHMNPAPVPAPGEKATYGPAYTACLETAPDWQDVTGDYSFLLAAPKLRGGGTPSIRMVDHGSSGAPTPQVTREGDAIRITFHLESKPGQALKLAYSFFAGRSQAPMHDVPDHLRVTFDSLVVHRAMDPGCSMNAFGVPAPGCPYTAESTRNNQGTAPPAHWNLYYDVGGVWGHLNGAEFSADDGSAFTGLDGIDLYVPQGNGWRLVILGRECDLGGLGKMGDCPDDTGIADDNDVPGTATDSYLSAPASIGTHTVNGATKSQDPTSTCPDVNPTGCYSVSYTVTLVDLDRHMRVALRA